jgi:hypothetical protein
MAFYEVIYENGTHSVMSGDSDEEALGGITEHHRRAVAGEAGGPDGTPAVRIKRVLKYDKHPNDYNESQDIAAKDVSALIKDMDEVTVPALVDALQSHVHPMVVREGAHDSAFKMEETGELAPAKWGGE